MTEDCEIEIVNSIKRGLADVKAGRVVPHDEAMAEVFAVIERARHHQRPDVEEP